METNTPPEPRGQSAVPQMFDPLAIKRCAARAKALGPERFLLDELQARLQDRLADITRQFDRVADIGGLCDTMQRSVVLLPEQQGLGADQPLGFQENGQTMPLAGAEFDLITSVGVLHRSNDLPGVLAQARRGLKPDGLFIGAFAAGNTLHELRSSLIAAESEVTGRVAPRVLPFGDIRDLGGLLQRAGLALPVADMDSLTVSYENPLKLMADLRAMGETNVLSDRSRRFLPRRVLMRAADLYSNRFGGPDGRVPATFQIAWLTGWAPHDSQQKPLKPGSAKASLAEALKPGGS